MGGGAIMSNCFIGEEKINKLVDAFHSNGYEIYAVGGCVRDLLMHRHPKDIDFCTNAPVGEMYRVVQYLVEEMHEKCYIIPTGEQYGTLTFHFDSGVQYEITCYRMEGAYHDGRHPDEVVFTTNIEEDLARRDFTCNAIAMNWETKELIDPFGGENDIKQGIIRCVGNPRERFEEDALRIIRLVRFAIKYEFSIEQNTLNAAVELANNIKNISKERIGAELTEIFNLKLEFLWNSIASHLLRFILNIIFDFDNRQVSYYDVYSSTNHLNRWRVCCTADDGDEKKTSEEINKFAVGKDICFGVRNLNRAINFYIENYCTTNSKKVLSIVRTDDERKAFFEYFLNSEFDARPIMNALIKNEPYDVSQLAVNGDWLKDNFGIVGEDIGKTLEKVLNFVIELPVNNTMHRIRGYLMSLGYKKKRT